jgi:MFS family permease
MNAIQKYKKCLSTVSITLFFTVCGRNHYKSMVAMVGSLVYGIGATLCGYVSDTYGRKMTILISVFFSITFHVASTFANSYALYLTFYLLAGENEETTLAAICIQSGRANSPLRAKVTNSTKFMIKNPVYFLLVPLSGILPLASP